MLTMTWIARPAPPPSVRSHCERLPSHPVARLDGTPLRHELQEFEQLAAHHRGAHRGSTRRTDRRVAGDLTGPRTAGCSKKKSLTFSVGRLSPADGAAGRCEMQHPADAAALRQFQRGVREKRRRQQCPRRKPSFRCPRSPVRSRRTRSRRTSPRSRTSTRCANCPPSPTATATARAPSCRVRPL